MIDLREPTSNTQELPGVPRAPLFPESGRPGADRKEEEHTMWQLFGGKAGSQLIRASAGLHRVTVTDDVNFFKHVLRSSFSIASQTGRNDLSAILFEIEPLPTEA